MSILADVSKEYSKDAKLKKDDVESLRMWAEKQPHLPNISELQYILFLQSCYYSNEQAKQAIENYFTLRSVCKDIFCNGNLNDQGLQMALDVGLVSFLPKTAPNGNKIVFMKLLDTNTDKYIFLDQTRLFDMVVTLVMHLNGTNEGINMIMDMDGATLGHFLKFNPSVAKKYLFYLQEALPIRLKEIHLITVPSWIDKLMTLLKPLLKKELLDMIHIHSNSESFHRVLPKEYLPKDYGGTGSEAITILADEMKSLVENNSEFFQYQQQQVTDESKRIEKSKDYSEILGLEGTFKKLDVD